MSFTRINTWGVGDEFTSAQANALALQLTGALDKSSAGDTLSGPIVFAGSGSISANLPGSILATVTGAIQTGVVGGITATGNGGIASHAPSGIYSQVDGGIALGGSTADWVQYLTARSRSIVIPCKASSVGYGAFSESVFGLIASNTPVAFTPVPAGLGFQTGGGGYAYLLDITAFVHDGATISSATLSFTAGSGHTSLPTSAPGFGLYRATAAGCATIMTGINAAANQIASPQGLYPLPANVSAYNGATFSVPGSMVGGSVAVVDKSSYSYFAILFDEIGGGAAGSTIFNSITLVQNNITSSRPG